MQCPNITNPSEIAENFNKPINYKDLGGKQDYIFFEHTAPDGKVSNVQMCDLVGRKTDVFECLNENEWKACIHYRIKNRR